MFQSVIMLAGMLTVAVTGTIEVGGVKKVWRSMKNMAASTFSSKYRKIYF